MRCSVSCAYVSVVARVIVRCIRVACVTVFVFDVRVLCGCAPWFYVPG